MYKYLIVCITLILLLSTTTVLRAESLWTPEAATACQDKKACNVGDIVTIIIEESATSTNSASTSASKSSNVDAGPGVGPILKNIPLIQYSGGDKLKASGSSTRTSNFETKMTATITKVLDNGNLVIEGSRSVQTNKEKEYVKLTGTIRKEDINSDNTILSTYIADAVITHEGTGPVGSRQKEGLINKIFKILF